MYKWYEHEAVDTTVIISSRVRLARNLRDYLFPRELSYAEAQALIDELVGAVIRDGHDIAPGLNYVEISSLSQPAMAQYAERHAISAEMVNRNYRRGLISDTHENVAIMLNEEDHVRIQGIFHGDSIYSAFDMAMRIDDHMSERLEFAFDSDFGYLTTCPTNTGTGMRASYMLHLPLMEFSGKLKNSADFITKAGFAIRGIHGEGSESLGSIYQISNQVTLGRDENEIIKALQNLAAQLVTRENTLRQEYLKDYRPECEDKVCRAVGILQSCRKISLSEAMSLLSDVRLGCLMGILSRQILNCTIYNLMINIQPFNLCELMGDVDNTRDLDINRAKYIRSQLNFH
ncbi:MAG: ATP--guanido phosphotransferase [Defluviitaleaceae bacterium]|nr:ATP--guanido phosphotransferase [Defluviitaleaceae bacterium]